MENLTLKQYFALNEINYSDIKGVANNTIWNIMRGGHDGAKYNSNYKGKFSYYPTNNTVKALAKWLNITEEKTRKLIDEQLKSLKKTWKKKLITNIYLSVLLKKI